METLVRKRSLPSRASKSRNAEANAAKGPIHSASPAGITKHPLRLLSGVARQSGIGNPDSCMIILSILSASRAVRRALSRELECELGFQDNSGSCFATLVTLYALSPLPATAADLAYHAEVSRASMADIIEALERRGLVAREAGRRDRITPICLTELGHRAARLAVHRFLQVASNLAGDIGSPNRKTTVSTCEQVESRAGVAVL